MLLQIRKSLSSTVVFILLALLIASFAFFGVGSIVTQKGTIVATVGSQKILANDLRDAFDGEMKRIREQFGTGLTTQEALQFGIHRQVLDQLILNAALDEEAKNLGLLGSDEEVRSMIRQMEFFYDLTGKFSTVTYEQALANRGWTAKDFEDRVRIDIARQQLIMALTGASVVPDLMQNTLFSYRKESRKAEIATIPASAVTNLPVPTEEELAAFYEARKSNFMSPEYRDLSFFILAPSDFAQAGNFSEEDLEAEYQRRYDEYNTPLRRAFLVAILRTKDEAEELIERVGAGEDFAAVTAEMTGLQKDDLLGGPSSYDELTSDYSERAADAVFKADIGGLTPPLETLVSWQIFQVVDETPGTSRPLDEVRDEVKQTLAEERGIDGLYNAVGRVDDEIAAGAALDDISEALGKPVIRIPAVTATGQTPEGSLIKEISVFPYLREAFQRFPDDELELVQSQKGEDFYIIQVNGITEPQVRPFEEIESQIRAAWVQEQTIKALGDVARQALAAAKAGESLTSIAKRLGGIRFETDSYVRDRVFTQRELSPDVASLMFSLGLGEVGVEQDARGTGYVLVRVTDITDLEPDKNNFEYQALRDKLAVEIKNDLFEQFQARLRSDLDIDINQDLLQSLFDSDNYQQPGLISE